jgi:hypothetical protein
VPDNGEDRVSDAALAELPAWRSFYVMVGSAGGALIGLQFVVVTLIASTVVTGCLYALLTAASISVPAHAEPALFGAAAALGLLLVAIHNASDTVTHIVISSHSVRAKKQ